MNQSGLDPDQRGNDGGGRPWRWVRPVAALSVLGLMLLGGALMLSERASPLVDEGALIEQFQAVCWLGCAVLSIVMLFAQKGWQNRLNALWLTTIALLATMREFDLQEHVNPENMSDRWAHLGINFNPGWWTDPAVPWWLKLGWGMLGLVLVMLLLVPPLLVRAPVVRLLRNGDGGTWLFGMALCTLFLGYAMDDLLGRGQFVGETYTRIIEEFFELFGVLLFGWSVLMTMRDPLSVRIARLKA